MDGSILELQRTEQCLSTGCLNLDQFLRGGLPHKGITQIYGMSGVGKTQLALQLCLTAQISIRNQNEIKGAAYICTESAFPSKRLQELFTESSIVKEHRISKEMIFIQHVTNTEDLEDCLHNPCRLMRLLSTNRIRLLIIDSIAATYRVEYGYGDFKRRAKSLKNISLLLQNLSKLHGIVVVCINQVTAIIKTLPSHIQSEEQPSLGITWANGISNSLYMYKKFNHRYLSIAGSPHLPCQTIEFHITNSGITAKENI